MRCLALCGVLAVLSVVGADTMRGAGLTSKSLDMKFHIEKVGDITVPVPEPGLAQVLIKVEGSSVNPVDHQIVASPLALFWKYPHVVGFDVSGTVVKIGSGVDRIKVGDQVWGQMGSVTEAASGGGAWAEYAVADERVLSVKPSQLNFTEAGVLPMVALTGYTAFSFAQAQSWGAGKVVVVLGGSGGTGHVGIQLAKAFGAAKVITTCGGEHAAFAKQMGADVVVDYHTTNWTDVVPDGSVDFVYNTVGRKGDGELAIPKIRAGGHYISLEGDGLAKNPGSVHQKKPLCIMECVQHSNLEALAAFVQAGKLRPHIEQVYEFDQAQAAFNHSLAGHTTGKVAVVPAASEVQVLDPAY